MKNTCITLLLLLVCISCGEEHTNYKASLENQTSVSILVLPYKSGIVNKSDTIKLSPNESYKIAEGSERGKIEKPFFMTSILAVGENDSIIVCFDNKYYVRHYVITPSNVQAKYHSFESNRNIINRDNYKYIIEKKRRLSIYSNHIYNFTEEDYEFAKE